MGLILMHFLLINSECKLMLMVYLNCTVVTYNFIIMHMVILNCPLVASMLLGVV